MWLYWNFNKFGNIDWEPVYLNLGFHLALPSLVSWLSFLCCLCPSYQLCSRRNWGGYQSLKICICLCRAIDVCRLSVQKLVKYAATRPGPGMGAVDTIFISPSHLGLN